MQCYLLFPWKELSFDLGTTNNSLLPLTLLEGHSDIFLQIITPDIWYTLDTWRKLYWGVTQGKIPNLLKITVLCLPNTQFSKERQNKTKAVYDGLAIYKTQLPQQTNNSHLLLSGFPKLSAWNHGTDSSWNHNGSWTPDTIIPLPVNTFTCLWG